MPSNISFQPSAFSAAVSIGACAFTTVPSGEHGGEDEFLHGGDYRFSTRRQYARHFADLVDRVAALVFVFDVQRESASGSSLHQLQDLGNRRVAGAELEVRPLIALAILDVQRDDAIVMLLQERDGVFVGGGEVADVEIRPRCSGSSPSRRSGSSRVANSFGSMRE